jgi:hypothetical protein
MRSTRYCPILIKFELSRQIFEKKYLNFKFYENPSYGSRVQCEPTDMKKLTIDFSQFCERA